jgi:hypothetical protein
MNVFYLYKPTEIDFAAAYSKTLAMEREALEEYKVKIIHYLVDYDDDLKNLQFILKKSNLNLIVEMGHLTDKVPYLLSTNYIDIVMKSINANNGEYYTVDVIEDNSENKNE